MPRLPFVVEEMLVMVRKSGSREVGGLSVELWALAERTEVASGSRGRLDQEKSIGGTRLRNGRASRIAFTTITTKPCFAFAVRTRHGYQHVCKRGKGFSVGFVVVVVVAAGVKCSPGHKRHLQPSDPVFVAHRYSSPRILFAIQATSSSTTARKTM